MKPTKNKVFCPRCKRQKMVFETAEKAHNFIKFNSNEMLEENGVAPVRAYYCEACGGWHVTSAESPFTHITRISRTNNRARYFLKQGKIKEAAKELAKAQALWVEVVRKERVNHQLEYIIKEIQKTRNALLECKANAHEEASCPSLSDNSVVINEPSPTMRVLTIHVRQKVIDKIMSGETQQIARKIKPFDESNLVKLDEEGNAIVNEHGTMTPEDYDALYLCVGYKINPNHVLLKIKRAHIEIVKDDNGEVLYYQNVGNKCVAQQVVYDLGDILEMNSDKE